MKAENLCKKMRTARLKAKLSIDDLSKKLGIESKFLSMYEDGILKPKNQHIKKIKEALNITTTG